MAIDRGFSLPGAGTIVTGSVVSGRIEVGDEVILLPGHDRATVRSLHAMNQAAGHGIEGDRCALNLRGPSIHHDMAGRGDWVVSPLNVSSSARCDDELFYLETERKPLRHWASVQLHHGAQQVDARIVLLDRDALQPGETALAQIVLAQPQPLRYGDAVIFRDPSAQRTIGGARALDSEAPDRNRRRPERIALLRAAAQSGWREALHAISGLHPVSVKKLLRSWGLTEAGLQVLSQDLLSCPGKDDIYLVGRDLFQALTDAAITALRAHHEQHPSLPGVSAEALRLSLQQRLPRPAFEAFLAGLIGEKTVEHRDHLLSLPEHTARVPEKIARLRDGVRKLLTEAPLRPPRLPDLAKAMAAPEPEVRKLCKQLARSGLIVEVAPDQFLMRCAIRQSAQAAASLSSETNGAFTAAQFRDRVGSGRQLAIHILNYLDRRGVTLRRGETRRLIKDPDLALGDGGVSW